VEISHIRKPMEREVCTVGGNHSAKFRNIGVTDNNDAFTPLRLENKLISASLVHKHKCGVGKGMLPRFWTTTVLRVLQEV
jgi:hypothetical protein